MFNNEFINTLSPASLEKNETGPLTGTVVVDFTHYLAGPLATMILADLGATVIKIEPPSGDGFRTYPPHASDDQINGAPYLWANRGKLGMVINLKDSAGKEAISAILKKADILVENFGTGVMDKLGLGYRSMSEMYPQLIYCSISAYGRTGPFSKRPGFDTVAQAESGFVSMNGYPDLEGVRTSSSVMDISTALLAANGMLAALLEKSKTGKGKLVEVALYDSSIMMTGYAGAQTLCTGKSPARLGNLSGDSCPTGLFRCHDASFFLHCSHTSIFKRLMNNVLQRPDLAEDPSYQEAAGRMKCRDEIFVILNDFFEKFKWDELKALFEQANVPAGEVRDLKAALLSEETSSSGMVERIPHSTLGWVPNIKSPIKLDGKFLPSTTPAPTLGEHTETILRQFADYSDTELKLALASGAFGVVASTFES